jgi:hypothetical protein
MSDVSRLPLPSRSTPAFHVAEGRDSLMSDVRRPTSDIRVRHPSPTSESDTRHHLVNHRDAMIDNRETRTALKQSAQHEIDAATRDLTRGHIDPVQWQEQVSRALAAAYLHDDDPRWQCGFDGDERLWREARSLILDAVPHDGTFIDIGCANGHLMESLALWAHERGQNLDMYGLELDPNLAAKARLRLPALAHRIFTGNVSTWTPPRRFTYVRTGLEYVRPGDEATLLRRLGDTFLEPNGRVIAGPINEDDLDATLRAFTAASVGPAHVVTSIDHTGKTRHVVWATANS